MTGLTPLAVQDEDPLVIRQVVGKSSGENPNAKWARDLFVDKINQKRHLEFSNPTFNGNNSLLVIMVTKPGHNIFLSSDFPSLIIHT